MTQGKENHHELPIGPEAFSIAIEALTEMIRWKNDFGKYNALSKATDITLFNIQCNADPEITDYCVDDHRIPLIDLKEETKEITSLKEWVDCALCDAAAAEDDELDNSWDIGDSETSEFTNKESFLLDVNWEQITEVIKAAWKFSKSQQEVEKLKAYLKEMAGVRERMNEKMSLDSYLKNGHEK